MSTRSVPRVVDLEVVRDSYDRVADNYVDMVATTGLGDVRAQPWPRAALDVFADAVKMGSARYWTHGRTMAAYGSS